MLTAPNVTTANRAIKKLATNPSLTYAQIEKLLAPTHGTTFAQLMYVTQVKTAAAHKDVLVQKVVLANVQLFNNLNAFTSAYKNAVQRTAAKDVTNDAQAVADFVPAENYFEHTACYSLVRHKIQDKFYLYAIYNDAASTYIIDGATATTAQVAALLTPAAATKLLAGSATTHNVTHDITHAVNVRTIALKSIVYITANGSTITV